MAHEIDTGSRCYTQVGVSQGRIRSWGILSVPSPVTTTLRLRPLLAHTRLQLLEPIGTARRDPSCRAVRIHAVDLPMRDPARGFTRLIGRPSSKSREFTAWYHLRVAETSKFWSPGSKIQSVNAGACDWAGLRGATWQTSAACCGTSGREAPPLSGAAARRVRGSACSLPPLPACVRSAEASRVAEANSCPLYCR